MYNYWIWYWKNSCITIGFAIGIGKVDLSAVGIDTDCQLLDFPIVLE